MGGFSIWHWLVLIFLILGPLAIIALVVWLVSLSKRNRSAAHPAHSVEVPARSTEERLLQLDALKSKGLISDAEHQLQRAAILRSI